MLLDVDSLKRRLNVFGINVLATLGHDHVLLATKKLEVIGEFEASEIAREKPSVHDGFGG